MVVGLDVKTDYARMNLALQNLLNGAELIGCSPDVTYLKEGNIWLGSGSFVKALEAASGKKAFS